MYLWFFIERGNSCTKEKVPQNILKALYLVEDYMARVEEANVTPEP
jgi:hypothetical protein